ncbi:NAD(P)H-hydrate dehydratase [Catenulispora subtropica]|uniref:Bifunctional NAD(P)H-hydrate repair enzyme n=1 Tax=Catenulispora subtropica TaxID=450798 RepID=A0ABN2R2Y5_9ACTN
MRTAFSVDQVRRAEAALMARLPEGELMQRAVAGLASHCARLLGGRVYGKRVVVVAGSGDNGGDALYAGARLARRGAVVEAVLLDEARAHAGGLAAVWASGGRPVRAGEWTPRGADLVLDGVVGIGGRGGLREAAAAVFDRVEAMRSAAIVVAVDVPSGVDSDTGEVAGVAVRADTTVTFGTYKPGLLISPGAEYVGTLEFVDIGLEPFLEGAPVLEALEAADVRALLPTTSAESNKYRRGVVGIAAGSPRYPGAAVLCTGAALRSGAGAVRFVGEDEVGRGVLADYPEVLVGPGRVQAWVVGPGIGLDDGDRVATALAEQVPVLVDADGLAALPRPVHRAHPTLITPHAGEAARLLGDSWTPERVEEARLGAVRELVARTGCTVLLKGSTTLIAEPGNPTVRVNPTGTPALATAGSGDVLSGLAGGLLATGRSPYDAASVAAWLHGQAARDRLGECPGQQVIAGDLVQALRAAPTA